MKDKIFSVNKTFITILFFTIFTQSKKKNRDEKRSSGYDAAEKEGERERARARVEDMILQMYEQTCYHLGFNIATVMEKKMDYIYFIKFVINP